jgi:hypothetical protein
MSKKHVSRKRFSKWISNNIIIGDLIKDNLTMCNDVLNTMVSGINKL